MARKLSVGVFVFMMLVMEGVSGVPASNIHGSATSEPTDLINLVQWPKAEGGNDHWYAVYPVTTHWQGAKAAVEALVQDSLPGYLATITSAEENEFITTHVLVGTSQPMPYGMDQFYLGGTLDGSIWSWLMGESFSYGHWGTGEPNNPSVERTLAIFGPNNTDSRRVLGYWNSVVLSDSATSSIHNAWSIVEFGPIDTSGQPTDLINLVQWPKAEGGNDHWYAVYPVTTHWQGAKAAVEALVQDSLPGYLATITSAEENEFITTHVLVGTSQPMPYGMDQFYLGGTLDGSIWSWLMGESFSYGHWGTGEPNNPSVERTLAIFGPNNTDSRRVLGYWNSVVLSDSATSSIHNAWSIVEFGPIDTSGQPTDLINLVQWPKAEGGNDHWYAVYPVTTHWQGAKAAVEALVQDSLPGYLATITSAEENEFITTHVLVGTSQPMPYGMDQFYLGGTLDGSIWSWLMGESFSYGHWGTGEPNNPSVERTLAIFGPNNTDSRRVLGYWNSVVLSDSATSSIHNAWSIVEFGPIDTSGQPTDLINLVQWPKAEGGNDHWYAVYPVTTHWQGAKAAVEALVQDSLPGYLATITSAEENEFITTHVLVGTSQPMPYGMDQFYLGGTLDGSIWSWLMGESFSYGHWGTGEPNNPSVERTLAIFGPNNTDSRRVLGYWNSVVLSDSATSSIHNAWSIVEFGPIDTSGQPTDLINLVQWPKAEGGNDHWYAVYPVTTHWQGAKAAVEALVQDSLPGYLATITSAEENEFITTHVLVGTSQPMPYGMDQFYLGGTLDGSIWSWLMGESFSYGHWGTGEPNNPSVERTLAIFGPNNTDSRRVLGYWNSVVLSDSATSTVHNAWSIVEFEPTRCCLGRRGNVDGDGAVDLSDLSRLICYLSAMDLCQVLPCTEEANIDGSGGIDLADLSSLINYFTVGGLVLPNCP